MSGTRFKVVVTDYVQNPDEELRILGDLANVVAAKATAESDLIGIIEDADAVLLYHFVQLTEATLERLQRCRLIVRCGVGYDNVDLQAASRRGIPVANVPDYGTEEVADSALGYMLALTRGIHLLEQRCRESRGRWDPLQARPVHRLRGRVFAIVGLGRIGKAVALRAKALGMDVRFYDPYLPDGIDKALGLRRVESLEVLLENAFVLSLHCPLNAETQRMIGRTTLDRLPRGSYLVNTARGAIVETSAVLDSLTQGHLAGAALDVLPVEPPRSDDPLLEAWRTPGHPASERLIINPHSAFYSEEGLREMRTKGAENVRRVLLGGQPRNVVNGVAMEPRAC